MEVIKKDQIMRSCFGKTATEKSGNCSAIGRVIPAAGELQRSEEAVMKVSTRYRLNGFFHQLRGTFRRFIGRISSNRSLGTKGRLEQLAGRLQGRVGRASGVIGL